MPMGVPPDIVLTASGQGAKKVSSAKARRVMEITFFQLCRSYPFSLAE